MITVVTDSGVEVVSPTLGPLVTLCSVDAARLPHAFLPDEVYPQWALADQRVRDNGGRQHLELMVERQGSSSLWLEANGTMLDGTGHEGRSALSTKIMCRSKVQPESDRAPAKLPLRLPSLADHGVHNGSHGVTGEMPSGSCPFWRPQNVTATCGSVRNRPRRVGMVAADVD